MNWFNQMFARRNSTTTRSGPTRSTQERRSQSRLNLESLEVREVPVVGAFDVPAALTAAQHASYDGVVQVGLLDGAGRFVGFGSGSLLETGRHILTAAHVVDGGDADLLPDTQRFAVQFEMPGGPVTMVSTAVTIHPSWPGGASGADLAVIELPSLAPLAANRYTLYRNTDEVGQVFTVAGYGATGTGAAGHDNSFGVKRLGMNRFERVTNDNAQLQFDFDDGHSEGILIDIDNLLGNSGLGALESNTAPGDSGGPSFIDWQIAAVTSGGRINTPNTRMFGDVSNSVRVSTFAPWIDGMVNPRDNIVLDMNFQAASPFGNSIDLWTGPSDLWIKVNGLETSIPLTQINALTIRGSSGSETIWIKDQNVLNLPLVVQGGSGMDTLYGPNNGWTPWVITGTNSGFIYGRTFSSIENLRGGFGTDEFHIRPGGSLSGRIDGSLGGDILDYSQHLTGVFVDLASGNATSVGGGISAIENVVGGGGSDFLYGNDETNRLLGNGGIDVLLGRGGEDWLYGGADNDTLDGGHDSFKDHLFGGSGVDTFVRHYNQAYVKGMTSNFWFLEADETDFNSIEDKVTNMYWSV